MDFTVAQRFFQPLLLLLAQATDKQLASYLQYLKIENRILRSRLPRRMTATPVERTRLLKVGKPLGRAIEDLITIVSPRTLARWVSQEKKHPGKPAPAAGKGGRTRKRDEVRALILKLASEGAGSGASPIADGSIPSNSSSDSPDHSRSSSPCASHGRSQRIDISHSSRGNRRALGEGQSSAHLIAASGKDFGNGHSVQLALQELRSTPLKGRLRMLKLGLRRGFPALVVGWS